MLLTKEHFLHLFVEVRKVQQTLNDYCLEPDKVPVSLDDLKYAIEQEFNVKIKQTLVPLYSDLLRGLTLMYDHGSSIFVDAGLPNDWTRYVVTKEMCHHLVNDPEHWTADPTEVIEYIVQDGASTEEDVAPHDIATEDLTKFATVELLFPFSLRKAAKARIDNGEDTLYTTAQWLEIPEHLVEIALRDRYMEYSTQIWAELG